MQPDDRLTCSDSFQVSVSAGFRSNSDYDSTYRFEVASASYSVKQASRWKARRKDDRRSDPDDNKRRIYFHPRLRPSDGWDLNPESVKVSFNLKPSSSPAWVRIKDSHSASSVDLMKFERLARSNSPRRQAALAWIEAKEKKGLGDPNWSTPGWLQMVWKARKGLNIVCLFIMGPSPGFSFGSKRLATCCSPVHSSQLHSSLSSIRHVYLFSPNECKLRLRRISAAFGKVAKRVSK